MKRILLALSILFLLISVPAFAAELNTSKPLTFQWEQPVDLEYISGWTLHWSATAGSGYVKVVDIPYVAGDAKTTFTTAAVLNVTGTPGSTVVKYFVMTASGKDGLISAYSNEISNGFYIPYPAPAAPFNLIIKVIVGP